MKYAEVFKTITRVAARQHGIVSRRQLKDAGATPRCLRTLLQREQLVACGVATFQISGSPQTEKSRLWASLLDAGPEAIVSHTTAAALFGLPGFLTKPHHMIGPRVRTYKAGVFENVLHEPVLLLDFHTTELDGVPVATPARTMFDLSGMPSVSTRRLARTIDNAIARNLTSAEQLDGYLVRLARRGRPGIRRIRALIHERLGDYVAPESGAEHRFAQLLDEWGVRGFERQVHITDVEGWVGRVDFAHSEMKLVVEIDTALYHGSLTDRRRDKERRSRLADAGWRVLAFDANELFVSPQDVRRQLDSVRRFQLPQSFSA